MPAETRKVLIADDEQGVHDFVQAALEEEGLLFVNARDGDETLSKARAEKPHLIILDVQMPRKDGFRVFSELRADAATRSIPVIMLTAVGQRTGIRVNAKDMGEYLGTEPEAYLDKPIDPQKLLDTVKKVLARR